MVAYHTISRETATTRSFCNIMPYQVGGLACLHSHQENEVISVTATDAKKIPMLAVFHHNLDGSLGRKNLRIIEY